jgi:hypothetical protein
MAYLARHGARSVFRRFQSRVFPSVSSGPIVEWLLIQALYPILRDQDWDRRATLIELGHWLLHAEKPIVKGISLSMGSIARPYVIQDSPELHARLDEDELFSLFALLAIFVEAQGSTWRKHLGRLSPYGQAVFERLLSLFNFLFSEPNEAQVRDALSTFTFDSDQQRFVTKWCTTRINLVERKRRSVKKSSDCKVSSAGK